MIGYESHDTSHIVPVADLLGQGEAAGFDLAVSPDGHLTRVNRGVSFHFEFRFRDRPFAATVNTLSDEVKLSFSGEFGVLPFTLEDRSRRAQILGLLPELRRAGLACEVTPKQVVRVGREMTLKGIRAPREILAVVIEQLVLSRTSFDAMAEIAYAPPKPRARRR